MQMRAEGISKENETDQGLGSPLLVRRSRIERYENQPRRHFGEKGLLDLADDIQYNGHKTPIRVCKHSSKSGVFVLIGGERRWRAFGIIAERTNTDPLVKCFIDTVKDERHHFREALIDNLQREDLVPLDEAASYARLYAESEESTHHAKVVEISNLVKKSYTHVENYIRIHSLPDEVKKYLNPLRPKDTRLSVTAAIDIARSTSDPVLQVAIAKEAIERELGVVEVRGLISIRTGGGPRAVGGVGRTRKPSDDYKVFKTSIGNMLARARHFKQNFDFGTIYLHRDDEVAERERDSRMLRQLIGELNEILEHVDVDVKKKM